MSEPIYRADVLVCAGTSCESSGARSVLAALTEELAKTGLDQEVRIIETGCRGFCSMGDDHLPRRGLLLPGQGR